MKRQIADRVFFGCYSLLVASIALVEKGSFSYRIVHEAGMTAELCLIFFCALCVVSLLDTLVNDLMPEQFHFTYGEKWRQGIWLLIAVSFGCHAYAIMQAQLYLTGLLYFAAAFRCSAISFIDLHGKVQDRVQKRRKADFAPSHAS